VSPAADDQSWNPWAEDTGGFDPLLPGAGSGVTSIAASLADAPAVVDDQSWNPWAEDTGGFDPLLPGSGSGVTSVGPSASTTSTTSTDQSWNPWADDTGGSFDLPEDPGSGFMGSAPAAQQSSSHHQPASQAAPTAGAAASMSVAERSQQLLASDLGVQTQQPAPLDHAGNVPMVDGKKASSGTSKRSRRAHKQTDSLKLAPSKSAAATTPHTSLSMKAFAALVLGAVTVVAPFAAIPHLRDVAASGIGRIAGYLLIVVPLVSFRFARSARKAIAEPRRKLHGSGLAKAATVFSLLGFLFGAIVYGNWLVGARFHEGDTRVIKVPVIGSIELPQSSRRNVLPGSAPVPAYDGVKVGDCVTNLTGALPTEKFNVVDCASPHVGEVAAIGKIDEASADTPTGPLVAGESFEAREQWVGERCGVEFATYVGGPMEATSYDISYYFPADPSWRSGYRDFLCLITEQSGGTTTGSAKPAIDPTAAPDGAPAPAADGG
jgi:hypothetical protein